MGQWLSSSDANSVGEERLLQEPTHWGLTVTILLLSSDATGNDTSLLRKRVTCLYTEG